MQILKDKNKLQYNVVLPWRRRDIGSQVQKGKMKNRTWSEYTLPINPSIHDIKVTMQGIERRNLDKNVCKQGRGLMNSCIKRED